MGRTSKFSFPMPGRKHTTDHERSFAKPPSTTGENGLSKAQRLLGTDNNLNIDSPTRDDHPWNYPGSRSSGMSISISESTQSIHEVASSYEHHNEQWDGESGVLPRNPRLYGKASSTLLGQRVGDDEMASSISSRLRNEDSSSTLKSFYDRQKSPLSISQQTSASSARDLALRKGFPPVIQRSPLLQVEPPLDPFEIQFNSSGNYDRQSAIDKSSKKKPSRLDLTKLFPKRNGATTSSPSSISTTASRETPVSDSGRRRLQKVSSQESIQSQQHSVRSPRSHEPPTRQNISNSNSVYEQHIKTPLRSAHMDCIPESRAVDTAPRSQAELTGSSNQKPNRNSYATSTENQPSSWRNGMVASPWEASSAASISSRNTRTSRHTNSSIISNSDLQEKSVLSLSSDSEESSSDGGSFRPPSPVQMDRLEKSKGPSRSNKDYGPQPSQLSGGLTSRGRSKKRSTHKETNFLEVPIRLAHPQVSATRAHSDRENSHSPSPPVDPRRLNYKEKRLSQTPSLVKFEVSTLQPTPPISPTSIEFRQSSVRSGRFMAVTKQEEALLEALRQKRARMRETIIHEHEIAKSPSPPQAPRIPERSASRSALTHSRQKSSVSSTNTIRSAPRVTKKKKSSKVLLYLNTPASEAQFIDAAKPSPDLSDLGEFLSYADSDEEDSTPRGSWQPPPRGGRPRPDSYISPENKFDHYATKKQPHAARLSAVGVKTYRMDPQSSEAMVSKKWSTGVKFLDHESRLVNTQDYILDENENEAPWRS